MSFELGPGYAMRQPWRRRPAWLRLRPLALPRGSSDACQVIENLDADGETSSYFAGKMARFCHKLRPFYAHNSHLKMFVESVRSVDGHDLQDLDQLLLLTNLIKYSE